MFYALFALAYVNLHDLQLRLLCL